MSIIQGVIGSIQALPTPPAPTYPTPGNNYPGAWDTSYGANGSPSDPGGNISSVPGISIAGLIRRTYSGTWSADGSNTNPGIFNGSPVDAVSDIYAGFGQSITSDNYCMEWKGYFLANATGTWNFATSSDDVAMLWIGLAALDPDNNAAICASNNDFSIGVSVNLTAGQYYPIRIRYQEWSGGERCEVYASLVDTTFFAIREANGGSNLLFYNASSDGY